jgi:serine kinase of HPr protein (carbohydrate metabolism regulator)
MENKMKPIDINHKAFKGLVTIPQRVVRKGRVDSSYIKQLTQEKGHYIYNQLVVLKVKCIALAEEFGVSQQTLLKIKNEYVKANNL